MGRIASIVVGCVLLSAAPVWAQVLQPPPRSVGGLFGGNTGADPDRTQQTLLLAMSSLGGYDDNLTPGESGGPTDPTSRTTGYTGFVDASLTYQRVHRTQALELGGRSFMNTYRNVGVTPAYGGTARAQFTQPLGRRHQLHVGGDARTDPFYALGALTPLTLDLERNTLPDTNTANGFIARRSWGGNGEVSLESRWTRRSTLNIGYTYGIRRFEDAIGDGETHNALVTYTHTVGRRSGLAMSFRATSSRYQQIDDQRTSTDTGTAEIGYVHEHGFSATRRLTMALGSGATLVDATGGTLGQGARYVLPSGYANVRIDLARTWAVSGDYRRSVGVIEGVTAEPYASDAMLVQLGGLLHPRLQAVVSAALATGRAPASSGNYLSESASLQLSYRLVTICYLVVGDSYSSYRLNDVGSLPVGLPADLHRNAIRVGIYFNVPLYGTFAGFGAPR